MINIVAIGSLFSVMVLIHMIADLCTQTDKMAMVKHENMKVRALHCVLYTLCFLPLFIYLQVPIILSFIYLYFLFVSHMIGDEYTPSLLWAKFIRRPVEMQNVDMREGFKAYTATPMGKALTIWVDQVYHLIWLFVIAYLLLL